MSVRRLAEDHIQPEGFQFNRAMSARAKRWIKKYPKGREQSAVIPLLMLAQEQEGWVSKLAIEYVANMLGMPYIRALEVATFYTQFQLKPVGSRAHIQVCGTTPCMLRGSEQLIALCKERIHPEPLQTNKSGTMSWEEVECQGACVNAPMVMIFKDSYEDLTPERLSRIIDQFEAGRGDDIKPGPQIDRIYSAAAGGQTTLLQPLAKQRKTRGPSIPEGPKGSKGKMKPKITGNISPVAGYDIAVLLKNKNRPAQIPRPKSPDDLKKITGIGPKLESILNSVGIYTFAQIAKWKKVERDWINQYLQLNNRTERDDWVGQAKVLTRGRKI